MNENENITIWLSDIEEAAHSNEVQSAIFGCGSTLDTKAILDWSSTLTRQDIDRMRATIEADQPDGVPMESDEAVLVWWAAREGGPWWVEA